MKTFAVHLVLDRLDAWRRAKKKSEKKKVERRTERELREKDKEGKQKNNISMTESSERTKVIAAAR